MFPDVEVEPTRPPLRCRWSLLGGHKWESYFPSWGGRAYRCQRCGKIIGFMDSSELPF